MRRTWFQDDNGTYYRNCPLIEHDQRTLINVWLPWRARALEGEWRQAYLVGPIRADRVDSWDRVAVPASFRDAYPHEPSMWIFDDPNP